MSKKYKTTKSSDCSCSPHGHDGQDVHGDLNRKQFLKTAGMITLANCTAPRQMDGINLEPARILIHFESDCGAEPKAELHKGQVFANIIPEIKVSRYVGLNGTIQDHPFMDICRSQIGVSFEPDSHTLAKKMTGYGDCIKETGYALKKIGMDWEQL